MMSSGNSPMMRRQFPSNGFNVNWGGAAGRLNYASPVFGGANASISDSSMHSKGSYDEVNTNQLLARMMPSPFSPMNGRTRRLTDANTTSVSSCSEDFMGANLARSMSRLLDDSADGSLIIDGQGRPAVRSTLPDWVLDDKGAIKLSLREVLDSDLINSFARDKVGCRFLQDRYPEVGTEDRIRISKMALNDKLFEQLCGDVFGNFFIQVVIENSSVEEQQWIALRLTDHMYTMCLNRYSCRVVQKAIEVLGLPLKSALISELKNADLVRLSIDQNANHVIQKIMNSFALKHWIFMVERLIGNLPELFAVAEDKYGCRVIQLSIEKLTDLTKSGGDLQAGDYLRHMMELLVDNCDRLASNEFANYIIQHIIKTDMLKDYRQLIIDSCLLRNLLSLSQEKYASHVVEKALEYAPPHLLKEMMEEIFDGYVPHPDTKKDALDIMLFHQFGNYVIQRMLEICVQPFAHNCDLSPSEVHMRGQWLRRLEERINQNRTRLGKYSSGKKILDTLDRPRARYPQSIRQDHHRSHMIGLPSNVTQVFM